MGSWNVVGELVIGYVAEWTHTPFVQVSTANPSFKSSFALPPLEGAQPAPFLLDTRSRANQGRATARASSRRVIQEGAVFSHLAFVCTCVRVQPLDANLIMTQTDSVSEAPGIPPKNRSNAQRMCVRLLVPTSRATSRATFCYRELSPRRAGLFPRRAESI